MSLFWNWTSEGSIKGDLYFSKHPIHERREGAKWHSDEILDLFILFYLFAIYLKLKITIYKRIQKTVYMQLKIA